MNHKYFASTSIKTLLALLSLTLLSACVEETIYPTQATQEITLLKNGKHSVRYRGTFRDAYPEWVKAEKALAKAQGVPYRPVGDEEDFVKSAFKELKSTLTPEIKVLGGNTYELDINVPFSEFHTEFGLPNLLQDFSTLAKHLVVFTALTTDGQTGALKAVPQKAYADLVGEIRQPKTSSDIPPQMLKELRPILTRIKGTLIIRTDLEVARHNAASVTPASAGLTEYKWEISGATLHNILFETRGKQTTRPTAAPPEPMRSEDCARISEEMPRKICILKAAPLGSSCKELIGGQCKCGPFKMTDHNGFALANTRYRIIHSEGEKEGCSDSDGGTISITVDTTGVCRLQKLPGSCS